MPSSRKKPGINQGPEIYDPEALRVESSRSERIEMSRFTDGRRAPSSSRKKAMKIVLLDLLLLCIIGGVLYPFIVEMNKSGDLEETRCRLELRRSQEDVLVSLKMRTDDDAAGNRPVDITVYVNGRETESFTDLTPPGGMERTLRYSLKEAEEKVKVEILLEIEDASLRLNAVSSASR